MKIVTKKKLYDIRSEAWMVGCSFEQHRLQYGLRAAISAAISAENEVGDAIAQAFALVSEWMDEEGVIPMNLASGYLTSLEKETDIDFSGLLSDPSV